MAKEIWIDGELVTSGGLAINEALKRAYSISTPASTKSYSHEEAIEGLVGMLVDEIRIMNRYLARISNSTGELSD